MRAVDENGNEGDLSNTVSASFVDPELFEYPVCFINSLVSLSFQTSDMFDI